MFKLPLTVFYSLSPVKASTFAYYDEGELKYGPERWYELPNGAKCKGGPNSLQSPIDLPTTGAVPLPSEILRSGTCNTVTTLIDLVENPSYRFPFLC